MDQGGPRNLRRIITTATVVTVVKCRPDADRRPNQKEEFDMTWCSVQTEDVFELELLVVDGELVTLPSNL